MAEVNLRKNSHNKLIGFLNQVNNHPASPLTYYAVGTIRERARETMIKCEGYHAVLVGAASDAAALAVQESAFTPIEATYQDLMNKLANLLATIPNPATPVINPASAAAATTAASTTPSVNIKLPAIELPTFDGSYANWTSFKDLFSATVGNSKQLADSQKLQYLKSALQGEPATIIKSMAITDANYKESWKLLNERYENKREIVFSLISKILDHKQLRSENAQELQALIDCVCESVRSLKVLSRPTDQWDDLLVVIVLSKLDPSTRREWAIRQTGSNLPTFEEMCTFVSSHIRGLLASVPSSTTSVKREKQVRVHHVNSESPQCQICNKSHHHHQCSELHSRKPADRSALVKKHHLCFNCLSRDHSVKSCSSKRSCRKCGRRHHTLLHFNGEREASSNQPEGFAGERRIQQQNQDSSVESNHISVQSHAILKTAVVNVPDRHGAHQQCRVFIDGGSQGNFISEACVSRLQLQRNYRSVTVTGFASTHVGTSRGEVTVKLVSRHNMKNSIEITAHIMPKLSSFLPSTKVKKQSWPHLEGLQLADQRWYQPGGIDIVVGVKHYTKIIKKERSEGGDHDPVALESIFGWIICGEANEEDGGTISTMHISIREDLDFIRKFWESEEFPNPRILTKEERECEKHFIKTHKRDEKGRFITAIPFNGKQKLLGASRDAAVRRLFQVERRLNRNPVYKEQYVSFMKEYLQLGHMTEIPANEVREVAGATNFLPHHFVLNEDSTTTKLRVVFDGSAKSTSGLSLNDTMLVGATLQDDLYDLLLRFRSYPIVLKADIAKMFRQFQLFPEDADFHRIVWRESADEPVRDFRLSTITYGTACATNLSTRCLQQLASDCEDKFPAAATALKESMFVDDLLAGEANPDSAILLFEELQSAMKTAGLELRKWCTNSKAVLDQIPEALREMNPQNFQDEESSVKTLGVRWIPSTDEFQFSTFEFTKEEELTMRLLLSNLARVFDPLGLISCVTVRPKIMYQELWRLSLGWDDRIPAHVSQLWYEYEEDLKNLSRLRIPRCVTADDVIKVELHGFADSSERALGGICYIRLITSKGVEVYLVTSKTKVAPLKQVSLPRLELDAALVTARLVVRVSASLKLTNAELFLWSDSTIVLRWIASPPRQWKTFVANQVAKIQDLTPIESWRHVPGL